jgi:DNA-directed RNA polymerase subunit L/DNA-directed RNA polymerase alpha subunit
MSIITNLKLDDNNITFELNNNINNPIKISLANSIRRTIISNIETYCVDKNNITFYDSYNDYTILNDKFLIDRLILIPIISDSDGIDYENVIISCKKENSEENIISVYVSDFVCKNSVTNESIDNDKIFKYPEILFTKLINNGSISFECKLIKDISEHGGSGFSPVTACSYQYKPDMEKIEENTANMDIATKQKYMIHDYQRVYKKNELGEPQVYQFYYGSIGFYDCKKLLKIGLNNLIDNFRFISDEFKNPESTIVIQEINNDDFFRFTIVGVNETLGEPLQSYLLNSDNTYYAGYIIEHPLKKAILLKMKLKENNTIENVLIQIDNTITNIITLLDQCVKDIE